MGSLLRRALVPLGLLAASLGTPAHAATNFATGGIGGLNNGTILNGDGTGSARITINAVRLALVKQARDASGVVLPNGAGVTPGQEIYFVLLVDNPTSSPSADLRISDALDETQFVYMPGSIEETTVPTGSGDAAIWGGVWSPLTDALGAPDDAAAFIDTRGAAGADRMTIGAVPGSANQVVSLPAASLKAYRFRVRVY